MIYIMTVIEASQQTASIFAAGGHKNEARMNANPELTTKARYGTIIIFAGIAIRDTMLK